MFEKDAAVYWLYVDKIVHSLFAQKCILIHVIITFNNVLVVV